MKRARSTHPAPSAPRSPHPAPHAPHAPHAPPSTHLQRARVGRLAAGCALIALGVAGAGCAGGRDLAAKLANAAVPSHMPAVMACWEKEFEASGFRGEYRATVDFVVRAEGSKIRSAKVRKLEATGADPGRDTSAFRACIEDALDATALPTKDDANGPGFATSDDLTVTGYVIAFVDASSKAREEAATRSEHVLIGPRSDRCQGLYTHDPPREEVDLYTAIGQADAAADASKDQPDSHARSLQRAYDLRLELRDRLRSAIAAPDLPEANRKKLRSEIEATEAKARGIGAAIGCKVP